MAHLQRLQMETLLTGDVVWNDRGRVVNGINDVGWKSGEPPGDLVQERLVPNRGLCGGLARHYPPSRRTRKNRHHSRTWHMMTSGQVSAPYLSLEGVFKLHL